MRAEYFFQSVHPNTITSFLHIAQMKMKMKYFFLYCFVFCMFAVTRKKKLLLLGVAEGNTLKTITA